MSLARPADRIRARAQRARTARGPRVVGAASLTGPAAGSTRAARVLDLGTAGAAPEPGGDSRETTRETATRDSI